MGPFRHLIEPSKRLRDPKLKIRAELLLCLLLFRFLAILGITIFLALTPGNNLFVIVSIVLVNVVAYMIARTQFFEWAALMIIVETIVNVPLHLAVNSVSAVHTIGAPTWLTLGPLISSLVLPTRVTALVILCTCLSFIAIAVEIDPIFYNALTREFLAIMACSVLALAGTYLRDKGDSTLELERAKVLQTSKLASLGEMAAGIAHELNSPLGAIVLNADMVEDEIAALPSPNKALIEKINQIRQTAERMSKIIRGLKTFSRESRQEDLSLVSAGSWVSNTLELCRERFQNRGVNVTVSEIGLEYQQKVQPVLLSQALLNLLNNAFDAIRDREDRWIKIEARMSEKYFELMVTDSGQGIPSSAVNNLFEPFFTTKGFGAGTGLGLSISKGILQNHGGDLIYDSKCPNTRFIMQIPMASVDTLRRSA